MQFEISEDLTPPRTGGLTLTILGSGVAIPQADRNAPGLLLTDEQNNLYFLIDCGSGSTRQVVRSGVHYTQISHLFLSHLHADHAADIPALFQALALDPPPHVLEIFGPPGTLSHCQIIVQKVFPFLENRLSFKVTEVEDGRVVGGTNWQVTCTKVEHFGLAALAYRFEVRDRVVVYSGDTAPCENLKRLAVGADLLVHECSYLNGASHDFLRGHSTPSQIAELVNVCKVGKLCLMHFYPEVARRLDVVLQQVRAQFSGEVILARDLLQITI